MQAIESTVVVPRPLVRVLGLFAAIALALAVLSFGWPQAVTGVLINALLLLTVEFVGLPQALILGIITPLGGALRGVLPLPMVVMIPFIALGNATLVSLYGALRRSSRALALVAGAVAKFVLLAGSVALLQAAPLTLTSASGASTVTIPAALAEMMRWPQLGTALAGGLVAQSATWLIGRPGSRKA